MRNSPSLNSNVCHLINQKKHWTSKSHISFNLAIDKISLSFILRVKDTTNHSEVVYYWTVFALDKTIDLGKENSTNVSIVSCEVWILNECEWVYVLCKDYWSSS